MSKAHAETVQGRKFNDWAPDVLLDNLDECVFLLDDQGCYRAVNCRFADWVGRAVDEIVGRTLWDLWPPELAEREAADNDRVLRGERIEQDEERPRGGQRRLVRMRKVPLRDAGAGPVRGILGLFRDVTEERQGEEEVRRARRERIVCHRMAGILHDVNNLLMVQLSCTPDLRQDLRPGSAAWELAGWLEQAAQQMQNLTSRILAYLRSERPTLRPVDLGSLLGQVRRTLERALPPTILLEMRLRPLPPVQGDATQLLQVILNLVLNARDAMPTGGLLLLEVAAVYLREEELADHPAGRAGSFVRLRVADTGTGMAPDVRDRIFEPFFSTKAEGQGTGLGLAIVRDNVEQGGGWIECASDMGRGTRFDVYLPASGPATRTEAEPLLYPSTGKRVLLVDNDAGVRQMARRVLEAEGHCVLLAESTREAHDICRRETDALDLVLYDLGLVHALEELRGLPAGPMVLLSGSLPMQEMPPETLLGRCGLLPKPYNAEQLRRAVRAALAADADADHEINLPVQTPPMD